LILATLAARLATPAYLEVGVSAGGSLFPVVEAAPTLQALILCDTWGPHHGGTNHGSHAHIDAGLDARGYRGARTYLDGRSHETLPAYVAAHPAPIPLVHVDADHTEAGAYGDLQAVWPIVGGVLVVHDVFMPAVWRAVERWLRDQVLRELVTVEVSMDTNGTAIIWRGAR